MKTIFKTVLYLSVMLTAASCVLDEIDSQPAQDPRLDCDALDSYTIQASKPQDISFRVSATTPWTISGFESAPWLSVSPASSAVSSLSEDIRIKTAANPDPSDRKVVITLKGENTDITRQITITQLRKGKLVVLPIAESEAFASEGGSKSFELQSNMEWEASAADSWLTLNPAKGSSDGPMKSFNVTATAEANSSINRSTVVTVVSGDDKFEFNVVQNGQTLEFFPVDDTAIDRMGGQMELQVNSSMDWIFECDNDDFKVTRDGSRLIVNVPMNNRFAPRSATVTIKPASSGLGDVSSSVELTQDVNFRVEGNCEILEDGSVKLSGDDKSRVYTVDDFRFVSIVLAMGDVHFGDKGQLWCATNVEGANIYNQLTLGGNLRLRTDGYLPVTTGTSTYKNSTYSISKDEMNALKEYRFDVLPDPDNTAYHFLRFYYNGTMRAELNFYSALCDAPDAAVPYWFGFNSASSDGTWYIVKTCDIIPVAE